MFVASIVIPLILYIVFLPIFLIGAALYYWCESMLYLGWWAILLYGLPLTFLVMWKWERIQELDERYKRWRKSQ